MKRAKSPAKSKRKAWKLEKGEHRVRGDEVTGYRLRFCWLARETRKGWKLAIGIDVNGKPQKDVYLKGVLIENPNAIAKALRKSPYRILFVHMRNSKWAPPDSANGAMRVVMGGRELRGYTRRVDRLAD